MTSESDYATSNFEAFITTGRRDTSWGKLQSVRNAFVDLGRDVRIQDNHGEFPLSAEIQESVSTLEGAVRDVSDDYPVTLDQSNQVDTSLLSLIKLHIGCSTIVHGRDALTKCESWLREAQDVYDEWTDCKWHRGGLSLSTSLTHSLYDGPRYNADGTRRFAEERECRVKSIVDRLAGQTDVRNLTLGDRLDVVFTLFDRFKRAQGPEQLSIFNDIYRLASFPAVQTSGDRSSLWHDERAVRRLGMKAGAICYISLSGE